MSVKGPFIPMHTSPVLTWSSINDTVPQWPFHITVGWLILTQASLYYPELKIELPRFQSGSITPLLQSQLLKRSSLPQVSCVAPGLLPPVILPDHIMVILSDRLGRTVVPHQSDLHSHANIQSLYRAQTPVLWPSPRSEPSIF